MCSGVVSYHILPKWAILAVPVPPLYKPLTSFPIYNTPNRAAGTGMIMYSMMMLVGLYKMLQVTTPATVFTL